MTIKPVLELERVGNATDGHQRQEEGEPGVVGAAARTTSLAATRNSLILLRHVLNPSAVKADGALCFSSCSEPKRATRMPSGEAPFPRRDTGHHSAGSGVGGSRGGSVRERGAHAGLNRDRDAREDGQEHRAEGHDPQVHEDLGRVGPVLDDFAQRATGMKPGKIRPMPFSIQMPLMASKQPE